jgi:putrescine aminotransferase
MTEAIEINLPGAATCLRQARTCLAPGLALGQKLVGRGAVEHRAHGAELELSDGRGVLDFGSYAVTLLGHNHPAVVAAVRHQLERVSTSTRVLANPATTALAVRLLELLQPSRLTRVWFGQSGSDAVEVALKLARRATGRPRVLAVGGGYHGKTLGALAATGIARYRAGLGEVLAPTTHLAADDPLAAGRALEAGDVAALIVEPIQGEGGIRPLSALVLRRWAEDVRHAGAFVIADEIQTGLRRAGSPALSLTPEFGIDPDAVLLGKPLGGGVMPLSAAVCSEELYSPLVADPFLHTSTFGGHPLSCAAALAGLEALDALADRIAVLGDRFAADLHALAARFPGLVRDVRGRGLLWGLELASDDLAGTAMLELSARGLLLSPCLGRPEVLRLLPPAIVSDAQVTWAIAALAQALDTARSAVAASMPPISRSGVLRPAGRPADRRTTCPK